MDKSPMHDTTPLSPKWFVDNDGNVHKPEDPIDLVGLGHNIDSVSVSPLGLFPANVSIDTGEAKSAMFELYESHITYIDTCERLESFATPFKAKMTSGVFMVFDGESLKIVDSVASAVVLISTATHVHKVTIEPGVDIFPLIVDTPIGLIRSIWSFQKTSHVMIFENESEIADFACVLYPGYVVLSHYFTSAKHAHIAFLYRRNSKRDSGTFMCIRPGCAYETKHREELICGHYGLLRKDLSSEYVISINHHLEYQKKFSKDEPRELNGKRRHIEASCSLAFTDNHPMFHPKFGNADYNIHVIDEHDRLDGMRKSGVIVFNKTQNAYCCESCGGTRNTLSEILRHYANTAVRYTGDVYTLVLAPRVQVTSTRSIKDKKSVQKQISVPENNRYYYCTSPGCVYDGRHQNTCLAIYTSEASVECCVFDSKMYMCRHYMASKNGESNTYISCMSGNNMMMLTQMLFVAESVGCRVYISPVLVKLSTTHMWKKHRRQENNGVLVIEYRE